MQKYVRFFYFFCVCWHFTFHIMCFTWNNARWDGRLYLDLDAVSYALRLKLKPFVRINTKPDRHFRPKKSNNWYLYVPHQLWNLNPIFHREFVEWNKHGKSVAGFTIALTYKMRYLNVDSSTEWAPPTKKITASNKRAHLEWSTQIRCQSHYVAIEKSRFLSDLQRQRRWFLNIHKR